MLGSGSTGKRMLVHVLVEIAQGFNETRPSEMLLGVPAAGTGESVGALFNPAGLQLPLQVP